MLDVAAGNGNATLAAARRFAYVTSTDYVPALLEQGAARARAEGLDVDYQVADAEDLPFANGTFDVAALDVRRDVHAGPRASRGRSAARRTQRRPHRPGELDAGGLHRPAVQGDRQVPAAARGPRVAGALGHGAAHRAALRSRGRRHPLHAQQLQLPLPVRAHWIHIFRTFYGPTHKAFAALEPAKQAGLERDIIALLERLNVGGDSSLVVPSEYLEVVVTKR